MANLMHLRLAARAIFDEALRAVDAGTAVRRAVQFKGTTLSIGDFNTSNRCIYAIAFGKAAPAMAVALDHILTGALTGGLLVDPRRFTLDQRIPLPKPWLCWHGGHPLPTRDSLFAAEQALELLDRANAEHALVIFLISGGGSAMIEWPINSEITLANIRIATKALIGCGASISEINAVRRAFSYIKGGRLAAKAPNCDQITLIVSDVRQSEEWNVASGPTFPPPADTPKAQDVIERYQLRSQLPEPILRAIDSDDGTRPSDNSTNVRKHFVLLDNNTALEAAAAAARKGGLTVEIARDISDEPIEPGVENLVARLAELKSLKGGTDVCLISGGEFACPVRGDGLGGRNLETALRLAIAADQNSERVGEFVALCAGTDGIDGNSPAAGAIVDSTTIERARRIGLDANDFLNRSDSYSFFVALGDAIATGPTGTNVRDLRIVLAAQAL
jgi:glycerate 2-kinase